MNIILTLDYELFFGERVGTVSRSITEATNRLLSVLNKYNIKAVFFVDVGYIKRLEQFKEQSLQLQKDYELISRQLEQLSAEGHDLQLHIHPHWEDSYYKDEKWNINADRYRLSDWSQEKIFEIVTDYKKFLEKFSNGNQVFAYRAGGWCIQPFDKIKEALKENDIWLDSTVFKGGYNNTETHYFNFKKYPDADTWRFADDPLKPSAQGYFREIPIASYKVSPIFFWKLAWSKVLGNSDHKPFGDGVPLPASKKWIIKRLLFPSYSVVSIDGYKASYLQKAFLKREQDSKDGYFVIIGHPKSLTNYSLKELSSFIECFHSKHEFKTFSGLCKSP